VSINGENKSKKLHCTSFNFREQIICENYYQQKGVRVGVPGGQCTLVCNVYAGELSSFNSTLARLRSEENVATAATSAASRSGWYPTPHPRSIRSSAHSVRLPTISTSPPSSTRKAYATVVAGTPQSSKGYSAKFSIFKDK
jgi:hypothetical protein